MNDKKTKDIIGEIFLYLKETRQWAWLIIAAVIIIPNYAFAYLLGILYVTVCVLMVMGQVGNEANFYLPVSKKYKNKKIIVISAFYAAFYVVCFFLSVILFPIFSNGDGFVEPFMNLSMERKCGNLLMVILLFMYIFNMLITQKCNMGFAENMKNRLTIMSLACRGIASFIVTFDAFTLNTLEGISDYSGYIVVTVFAICLEIVDAYTSIRNMEEADFKPVNIK